MSGTQTGRIPVGATSDDVGRLWSTLTTEYIPQLRIEVRVLQDAAGRGWISVEVVDDSAADDHGSPLVNVWAMAEYRNQLYLISLDQLFNLLIVAHRQIDGFFREGLPFAPTLRRR